MHVLTGPLSHPVAACTVPVPCACCAALACQMKVFSAALRTLGGKKGNIFKANLKKTKTKNSFTKEKQRKLKIRLSAGDYNLEQVLAGTY